MPAGAARSPYGQDSRRLLPIASAGRLATRRSPASQRHSTVKSLAQFGAGVAKQPAANSGSARACGTLAQLYHRVSGISWLYLYWLAAASDGYAIAAHPVRGRYDANALRSRVVDSGSGDNYGCTQNAGCDYGNTQAPLVSVT
jgi:hypothetical protein